MMASDPTKPDELRSLLAARYLEIICKRLRDDNDDLEEYTRQFQLCLELMLPEHVNGQRLVRMLHNGLPPAMIRFMKSTIINEPQQMNDYGRWPPKLDTALHYAKAAAASIQGIPRLTGPLESRSIDDMLHSFGIHRHHNSDFKAIARFERFNHTLRGLNNDLDQDPKRCVELHTGLCTKLIASRSSISDDFTASKCSHTDKNLASTMGDSIGSTTPLGTRFSILIELLQKLEIGRPTTAAQET